MYPKIKVITQYCFFLGAESLLPKLQCFAILYVKLFLLLDWFTILYLKLSLTQDCRDSLFEIIPNTGLQLAGHLRQP